MSPVDNGARRRAELGRFLRARRAELDPRELGLPVAERRRAPGLLREEVAALSGISTTWYTYLEQGRRISPSPSVLNGLSQALRLDEEQRRYLQLMLFGQAAPVATPPTDLRIWAAVVEALGGTDQPFYAANQYGEMLAWNDATIAWYTDFAELPTDQRSMIRWMLRDPAARSRFPEWQEEARNLVGRLRSAFAERPNDPRMLEVIRNLHREVPEFRTWWDEQHVAEQRARPRRMCSPVLGERTFRLVALRNPEEPLIGYLVHLPG